MEERQDKGFFSQLDWLTVVIWIVLLALGWLSVCGASYDFGDQDFFSFDTRAGKQLLWIGLSFCLGFVLLMLEERLYEMFAKVFYGAMVLLLVVTIFIAPDTKGSHSWLIMGPVSIQPAEFAKAATALCLAKVMGSYSFSIHRAADFFRVCAIILGPMLLIILQRETGSALVYCSFFLMMYREGMPGSILSCGISAVLYFVIGLQNQDVMFLHGSTSAGGFAVLLMITLFSIGMAGVYSNDRKTVTTMALWGLVPTVLALLFSYASIPFDITTVQVAVIIGLAGYLLYRCVSTQVYSYLFIAVFSLCSLGFHYSTGYVMNNVMENHQRTRINVLLGIEDDPSGAGYNVNQSKIAIGSGGLTGKGFLNGTQTKLKYVPEQDTDFIFCTVGEEQGFVGSAGVLLLFLALILRLVKLAERQTTRFGRVYGYSVLGIFFFHVFINVGMVLGLTPVIGIPLPFFSYGGSSLWGFTILLFIFLRIDADREKR